MEVIAIANHKGGVGKTTTAANLAAGLARAGRRTLLIDVDAQANVTSFFLDEDAVTRTMRDPLVDSSLTLADAICPTRIEGLDLVPATLDVARLDFELVSLPAGEARLRRALTSVGNRYDYVLLDLAPSLSMLTLASLHASDRYIVPVKAAHWGVRGLVKIIEWIEEFRAEGVINASLLGVLVTMVDMRTTISRSVVSALRATEGIPLFEAAIPARVGAENNIANRLLLGDPEAEPDLALAYAQLTREVLERIEGTETEGGAGRVA